MSIRQWLQTSHGLRDDHPVWLVRNQHDRVTMRLPDTTLGELWGLVNAKDEAARLRAVISKAVVDLDDAELGEGSEYNVPEVVRELRAASADR